MDQDLVDYLDRRFGQLQETLDSRFMQIDDRFVRVDVRFTKVDRRFDQVDGRLAAHDARFEQIEIAIHESAAETRRHFGVLAEQLRSDIQLVAEGVGALDQKLGHFRVEVNQRFGTVETRLARLEARRP